MNKIERMAGTILETGPLLVKLLHKTVTEVGAEVGDDLLETRLAPAVSFNLKDYPEPRYRLMLVLEELDENGEPVEYEQTDTVQLYDSTKANQDNE